MPTAGLRCLSMSLLTTAVTCGVCLLTQAVSADAQAIQITSPVPGSRVAPGGVVTVVASLSQGITVNQMIIIGEDPIGLSAPLAASPFQFSITIPTNIKPGLYHITADAIGSQGQDFQSQPTTIDVEPALGINSLNTEPKNLIRFRFVGDNLPVRVLGTLTNGTEVDLSSSTLISYGSSNTNVATVSQTGVVTAVGSGSAYIKISGAAVPFAIPVFVPNVIRGDLNGDGRVDIDDVNILDSFLNTPANGPNDARDLNHDGVINALDARILVTLCTKPGCVTH